VGDLAAQSAKALCEGLGDPRLARLVKAIDAWHAREDAHAELGQLGLLEAWRALLLEQRPRQREVIIRRAGIEGQPETLQAIGDSLRRNRQRIQQIEEDALAILAGQRRFLDRVRAQVDAVLPAGAVALASLSGHPWWAAAAARPEALDYFGARVLGGGVRIVELDGVRYLARCAQADLDRAWRALCAAAADVPLPAPLAALRRQVEPTCWRVGPLLAERLFERLRGSLDLDPSAEEPVVTSLGDTLAAALLAVLRSSRVPMRLDEVAPRAGASSHRKRWAAWVVESSACQGTSRITTHGWPASSPRRSR
jgi:hypothetical protein